MNDGDNPMSKALRPIERQRYPMRVFFSVAALSIGSAAVAQESIYDRCLAALDANNAPLVSELAATMKRFNAHPAQHLEKAERCVSAAEGRAVQFDYGSGAFSDASEVEQERQEKQDLYAEQRRVKEARRRELEERKLKAARLALLNEALIRNGVYDACVTLFGRDSVLAMTNPLCVDSFGIYGHPLLANELEEND